MSLSARPGDAQRDRGLPQSRNLASGSRLRFQPARVLQWLNAQIPFNFQISSLCDLKVTFLQSWGPELGPVSIPAGPREPSFLRLALVPRSRQLDVKENVHVLGRVPPGAGQLASAG